MLPSVGTAAILKIAFVAEWNFSEMKKKAIKTISDCTNIMLRSNQYYSEKIWNILIFFHLSLFSGGSRNCCNNRQIYKHSIEKNSESQKDRMVWVGKGWNKREQESQNETSLLYWNKTFQHQTEIRKSKPYPFLQLSHQIFHQIQLVSAQCLHFHEMSFTSGKFLCDECSQFDVNMAHLTGGIFVANRVGQLWEGSHSSFPSSAPHDVYPASWDQGSSWTDFPLLSIKDYEIPKLFSDLSGLVESHLAWLMSDQFNGIRGLKFPTCKVFYFSFLWFRNLHCQN